MKPKLITFKISPNSLFLLVGLIHLSDWVRNIAWNRLTKLSSRDADIVLHPNVGEASLFDVATVKAGEQAARQALPTIYQLLAEKDILITSFIPNAYNLSQP